MKENSFQNNLIDNVEEKSLEEIIREIAEEEGMTYEETMKLFRKGLKQATGIRKVDHKKKAKAKAKRKEAKKSRKKNR